jgi:hypothetical protein
MLNIKMTSLLLAGLLSAASLHTFAGSNDSPDTTGSKSGATSGPVMPPDNTPSAPSGGNAGDGGANGSSSGSAGGSSGSGAGGGTGSAGRWNRWCWRRNGRNRWCRRRIRQLNAQKQPMSVPHRLLTIAWASHLFDRRRGPLAVQRLGLWPVQAHGQVEWACGRR